MNKLCFFSWIFCLSTIHCGDTSQPGKEFNFMDDDLVMVEIDKPTEKQIEMTEAPTRTDNPLCKQQARINTPPPIYQKHDDNDDDISAASQDNLIGKYMPGIVKQVLGCCCCIVDIDPEDKVK